jgi:hypothetical protein
VAISFVWGSREVRSYMGFCRKIVCVVEKARLPSPKPSAQLIGVSGNNGKKGQSAQKPKVAQ